jgi:hypothetical protein
VPQQGLVHVRHTQSRWPVVSAEGTQQLELMDREAALVFVTFPTGYDKVLRRVAPTVRAGDNVIQRRVVVAVTPACFHEGFSAIVTESTLLLHQVVPYLRTHLDEQFMPLPGLGHRLTAGIAGLLRPHAGRSQLTSGG